MQDWLRDLSSHFVRLPAEEIDAGIQQGLQAIIEFLDVDRTTLFEFVGEQPRLFATHSCARGSVEPLAISELQASLPWYFDELISGRSVVLERLPDDLPAEAREERDYTSQSGIRSNLTIPISLGGRPICALAIGSFGKERTWPPAVVDRLQLAGEVLAAALHRSRATRAVREAQVLAQDFFDSLDSRAAVLDAEGRIVSVNRAWREQPSRGTSLAEGEVGSNCLEAFDALSQRGNPDAAAALTGLRSVLKGDLPRFLLEYEDSEGGNKRWYLLRVLRRTEVEGAVLMHIDVTDRVQTSLRLQRSLEENDNLRKLVEQEKRYLRQEIQADHDFENIIGSSSSLRHTLSRVERVAATDATVLLLGETGTGKELLAHAIHERSRRSGRALVKINCAALPPSLIESELFGHRKGAFTGAVADKKGRFELAHGGSLFLDEIGDLDLELQAKLLRVLQSGEYEPVGSPKTHKVDVRIIAATHRNLREVVGQGTFRADLFHRLNTFPIEVPPLRQRTEDIAPLAWHFIDRCEREWGHKVGQIPAPVMEALRSYEWPGNVRELKNVIERAVILSPGDELLLDPGSLGPIDVRTEGHRYDSLDSLQRNHISRVLESCSWRINGPGNAAERLGIHPNTLRHRMKKLGIQRPR